MSSLENICCLYYFKLLSSTFWGQLFYIELHIFFYLTFECWHFFSHNVFWKSSLSESFGLWIFRVTCRLSTVSLLRVPIILEHVLRKSSRVSLKCIFVEVTFWVQREAKLFWLFNGGGGHKDNIYVRCFRERPFSSCDGGCRNPSTSRQPWGELGR